MAMMLVQAHSKAVFDPANPLRNNFPKSHKVNSFCSANQSNPTNWLQSRSHKLEESLKGEVRIGSALVRAQFIREIWHDKSCSKLSEGQ